MGKLRSCSILPVLPRLPSLNYFYQVLLFPKSISSRLDFIILERSKVDMNTPFTSANRKEKESLKNKKCTHIPE